MEALDPMRSRLEGSDADAGSASAIETRPSEVAAAEDTKDVIEAGGPRADDSRAVVQAVPFSCVAAATDNFSPANLIGAGAVGQVFKGTFNGHSVAVKRMSLPVGSFYATRPFLERQYRNELSVVSSFQHPRIVRPLACAVDDDRATLHPFALVFELLQGSSLAHHLRPFATSTDVLSAAQRIDIVLGACEGLCFLHGLREPGEGEGAPTVPVLHRDIKSANIGLAIMPDGTYFAKLLDCGIARALRGPQGSVLPLPVLNSMTVGLRGTRGYMAPELVGVPGSVQSDIYAFGVVLLELFLGRLAEPSTAYDLDEQAKSEGTTRCIEALADPVWPKEHIGPLAGLIAACIRSRQTERPADMAEVRARLQAIRDAVPIVHCPLCLSYNPGQEGVRCAGGKDGKAERHFMCLPCLQQHVRSKSTPESLIPHEGLIPCPESGCQSPAWSLGDLPLESGTLAAYVDGLRQCTLHIAKATREV